MKWQLFSDFLPEEILRTIASFEVHQTEELEDQLIWDSLGHADFSIKFALSIIKLAMDIQENQV